MRFHGSVFGVAFALASVAAHADIYVLVDRDGPARFTNVPDDARYRLYMREPTAADAKPVPRMYDNPRLATKPFGAHVLAAARASGIDPALVHAVIAAESNYDPNAVSPKGAVGLMQLMPDTARRYGVKDRELKFPEKNIRAGVRYLADLLRMFEGNLTLALAGYNAGEGVVFRYGKRIPPYPETEAYVPRVLQQYEQLRLR